MCVLLGSVMDQKAAASGFFKKKPSVVLQASSALITLPCPPNMYSAFRSCPSTANLQVALTSTADGFVKQARYAYTVTVGQVVGAGSKVTWDLNDTPPGIYTASVEVQDNKKHHVQSSVTVTIQSCGDCMHIEVCGTMFVNCYDQV